MKNLKLPFKNKEYNPIFLDVETQFLSDEVEGGWNAINKFKVSVAVTWDQKNDMRVWQEEDVRNLLESCREYSPVVTFNGDNFDFVVLSEYGDVGHLYTESVDLLKITKGILGHRVHMDSIAKATLGTQKTADGVQAVKWWRSGDPEQRQKVIDYCKSDVGILRDVYLFARNNGYLMYESYGNKRKFNINLD
jgi:DEAD/DEAH box helicase domain-containing protein